MHGARPHDCLMDIQHEKGVEDEAAHPLLSPSYRRSQPVWPCCRRSLPRQSEAKLGVNENCVQSHWPCWAVPGSGSNPTPAIKVTIAVGGEVKFADNGTAAAVVWQGSAPACSGVLHERHDQMGKAHVQVPNNQGLTSSKARRSSTVGQARTTPNTKSWSKAPPLAQRAPDDDHNHDTDDNNERPDAAERTQSRFASGGRIRGALEARWQPTRIDGAWVDPRCLRPASAGGWRLVCRRRPRS